MSADEQKKRAGEAAADHVESGMKLGLGTGSTADHFTRSLGVRIADGLDVVGVPTSEATADLARSLGIPLTTLDEEPELDLAVDGADELDARLRLIKGGGGALLREKIVASCARRMIVIADDSKQVGTLGKFPLPVEVMPFGALATARAIGRSAAAVGCEGSIDLRIDSSGEAFITDGGHLIYDCAFGAIPDPENLAHTLSSLPGVVEHGLFIGFASIAILGTETGIRTVGRGDLEREGILR